MVPLNGRRKERRGKEESKHASVIAAGGLWVQDSPGSIGMGLPHLSDCGM